MEADLRLEETKEETPVMPRTLWERLEHDEPLTDETAWDRLLRPDD